MVMLFGVLCSVMDSSRKTKIGIRRKHTSFLRRSDIGQFVTCDDPHFSMATLRRRSTSRLARSSMKCRWT
jgi:hypothetical protein